MSRVLFLIVMTFPFNGAIMRNMFYDKKILASGKSLSGHVRPSC